MRTLKVIEHLSLDGVIQHSADDDDFPYPDWSGPSRRSGALDHEIHRSRGIRLTSIEGQHHERPRQAVGRGEVQRVERSDLVPTADTGGSLEARGIDRDDVTPLPVRTKPVPQISARFRGRTRAGIA
jgi:hypothetical protein